ncbi:MAG: hypothetical protein K1X64_23235 [Myxococcaceae bacterium]|nr:hypothetical protein [Myxococcaceae bacterium]
MTAAVGRFSKSQRGIILFRCALLFFGLGCATMQEKKPIPIEEALAPAPEAASAGGATRSGKLLNPKLVAANYTRPSDCEAAARVRQAEGADYAWKVLKACVAKGNFTMLESLLQFWGEQVKEEKDGAVVLAEVLAARGAVLATDMQLLNQNRIAVFDLDVALRQPSTYRGKYVLVRGKVTDVRASKGAPEVRVMQMGNKAAAYDKAVGRKFTSSGSSSRSGSMSYNTSNYGSGRASGSVSSSGSYSSQMTEEKYENVIEETGQEALVRLTQTDPFLVVDGDFLFLTRFDGTKKTDASPDDEVAENIALLSLVSYHPVRKN